MPVRSYGILKRGSFSKKGRLVGSRRTTSRTIETSASRYQSANPFRPTLINNYLGTSPISARDLPSKNAQRFENKFINYVPLFPGDFIKSPSIRLVCNVYLFSALHREVTRVHKGHVLEPTQHRSLDQHQTSERTTEKYTRIT